LDLVAKGAPGHCPAHPACHSVILQPDIAASLTPDDPAACKIGPAFPAHVDDDFSIARTDLQRDEAAAAFGIATAESTDVAAHFALLSCLLWHHQWHQACQGLWNLNRILFQGDIKIAGLTGA
jgi:hypothetical protein